MKVSSERIAESQVVLNIEFEPDTIEKSMDRAYRRLVVKTNIPGFRKGKAPRSMLERYIGRTALLEEALDIIFPDAYEEALKQENVDAIGQPKVELAQIEPVILKAIVPVRPTITLGNYKDIRFSFEVPQTTDEEVESVIDSARNQAATWNPVDRPVELEDMVTMDIESTVDGSPSGKNEGIDYRVAEGSGVPVPGFAEQLVGMCKSDVKEIDVSFPEDDEREDLKGKKFLFKVTLNEIKAKNLPDLNDEFAKSVNEEFETLEQLRSRVKENLERQAETDARDRLEDNVINALISGSQIEFPPQLTEHEVEHMIEDQREQLQSRGITLEQFLRIVNKTMDTLQEEMAVKARDRISRTLVLDELARAESIEVGPEDLEREINALASAGEDAESVREAWKDPDARSSIERALKRQKTISTLIEIATEGVVKAVQVGINETATESNPDVVSTAEVPAESVDEGGNEK